MRALILAGGRGTRLRPFTTSFPKPLMPIGELPILEILLRQLRAHDVKEVTLMTGHLAYLIEGYFGDGAQLGLDIGYEHEDEPRGTAGPLRRLAGKVDGDVLVMNGDLLTDVDFSGLMARHRETGAVLTVGAVHRSEHIELGVLKIDESSLVVGYHEKPKLEFDVSMGLYAMASSMLERIPDRRYDMPEFVLDLIAAGDRVAAWRHEGFWLDIGRVDDYERANELFARDPSAFLPGATPPG